MESTSPDPHIATPGPTPIKPLTLGPFTFDPSIWVYTTVTLMSLLVVFDGWTDLEGWAGIVTVVVGPTIALAAAHVFADVISHTIGHSGVPGRHLATDLARDALQFLLVAVPPLLLLVVTYAVLGWPAEDAIQSMLVLGMVSLGFWGGLAGWRGGYRGWGLVLAIGSGLVIGAIVFGFQLALKPH